MYNLTTGLLESMLAHAATEVSRSFTTMIYLLAGKPDLEFAHTK